MSDEISSEADFIFKVSVSLLCCLCLLCLFVLFLVLWLRKIQKRVHRLCKEWRVYSKVACVDITPPERENLPEMKNGFSFPLVISNKRAVNSDTKKSWENINRNFAYAQADHEDDEGQPDLERVPVVQGEDQTSVVDGSTSREAALPKMPKDTSCIKMPEDDSPSVLFLSGKYPGEKQGERRIFTTLHGHAKVCEESTPAKKEHSLVLIDANNSFPENEEDWFKLNSNDAVEQQSLSKETNILETEEKSFDGKQLAQYLVSVDENSEKSKSRDSHGETLLSEGTSGISESAECTMPRHEGEESEILIPTATEPNEKHKPKPRKRTKKRSKGQRKSRAKSEVPVDNLHEIEHVKKLAEDEHAERENVAQEWKFRQTSEQPSEPQGFYQNSVQGGHEYLPVEHVENLGGKTGPDVPVNRCPASASANTGVQMQRHVEVEDSYESITTSEPPKQWPAKSPRSMNLVNYDKDEHNKEPTQDFQNLSDEVYSNIDNDNDGVKDISTGASPFYVNYNNYEHHVDQEFADDSHIYANADELQQESVMFNDNPAFNSADEGPIYVNITEVSDV